MKLFLFLILFDVINISYGKRKTKKTIHINNLKLSIHDNKHLFRLATQITKENLPLGRVKEFLKNPKV